MEVKLNSLTVTDYDQKDLEKVKFVKEVSKDKEIKNNVYPHPEKWLTLPNDTDDVEECCTYMVKDDDNLVGFFKTSSYFDKGIGIDYAVHSNYRNKGYGSKILLEVSNYFLKHNAERIILCINNSNVASRKAAEHAGFTLETKIPDNICVYEKRK